MRHLHQRGTGPNHALSLKVGNTPSPEDEAPSHPSTNMGHVGGPTAAPEDPAASTLLPGALKWDWYLTTQRRKCHQGSRWQGDAR